MAIIYHPEVEQGSNEWHAMRCGILTASEMRLVTNPPPKVEARIKKNGEPYKQREQTPAENEAMRMHLFELLSQRITQHVEPQYIGDAMLRGFEDEITARDLYSKTFDKVTECGFITNDNHGFMLGYSPDGLVGKVGLIECKSRVQKYQVQAIARLSVPEEHVLQVQTGLLVTEREWLDYITYSAGLPMMVLRVYPDEKIQAAILEAAGAFEERLKAMHAAYLDALASDKATFIATERPAFVDGPNEMFVDELGNYS